MKMPRARSVAAAVVMLVGLSTGLAAAQTTPDSAFHASSRLAVAMRRWPTSQAPAAAPSGNAENGKALFKKNACYQCHGYEGQGGTAGPRVGPGPILFRAFVTYVRAPREEMPPFTAKVMSDEQLADVYAFLQSRPRPPAVENIPLLAR